MFNDLTSIYTAINSFDQSIIKIYLNSKTKCILNINGMNIVSTYSLLKISDGKKMPFSRFRFLIQLGLSMFLKP